MRVINCSENPVYLDDIDLVIPFGESHDPTDINDGLAMRSKTLAVCLANGMVVEIDKEGQPMPGKWHRRQSLLVSEEDFIHQNLPEPPSVRKKKDTSCDPDKVYAVWHGPATDYGGYANMNRRFMFGLSERGTVVRYDSMPSMPDADEELMQKISALSRQRVPAYAPKVYGMTAPLVYDWARYRLLFTMMETRRLHPEYAERCNCADEIVVPSEWCREVFEESGVTRPMTVVPLGVDTRLYKPGVEPIGFSKRLKDFVFLSVFGWSARKGYDVLLKAYLEEFTSEEPVSLVIMSRYFGSTDEAKKKKIKQDVAEVSATVDNPNKPHVVLFGDTLSEQMMPRLYAAANCYVLISRGEGFGLPYCEAAACGLPVIGSRYSGQTDFLNDDNSYLVDVDGFRKGGKELSWISRFYEDMEFPVLGAPAVDQTRAHMRHVFENQEEAAQKGQLLRDKIVEEYDWSVGIGKMHDVLARLNEERKAK